MPAGTGRKTHMQLVHYLRKTVNFNDANIAAGVVMGTIPGGDTNAANAINGGAMIVVQNVRVRTAFNAGTTNALNVGTTAGGTQLFTDVATAGARSPAIANLSFLVDTDIFVQYAQTGAVATAGAAEIVIGFVPNNDL